MKFKSEFKVGDRVQYVGPIPADAINPERCELLLNRTGEIFNEGPCMGATVGVRYPDGDQAFFRPSKLRLA